MRHLLATVPARFALASITMLAVAAHAQPAPSGPPGMQPTLAPPPPPSLSRRASDERLFMTPTELTLRSGELVLEDDVGISARVAIGITRRAQLDLRIGGMLVPGVAGGAIGLPGAIVAGGGAGVALVGLVMPGVKVQILDEGPHAFGLAAGYDLMDTFGLAAGGAGIAILGVGGAGAGVVAVGGANLQFNLFSLAAGKHWGRAHVTGGTYLLDNHHFIPQAAGFATACGAGGVGEAGAGGAVAPCGSGSKTIDRLPTQVQPFLGIERAIGEDSSISAEILFHRYVEYTTAATGARWFVWRRGDVRVRLDVALVWSRLGYPLPWAGVGIHFR